MSLTEHGLGVADGIRGKTFEHLPPPDGPDTAPGITVLHEDGFAPRNSGRPDLYPGIPHHFRGPVTAVPGRLDEVTEPAPELEAPIGLQVPPSSLPLRTAPAPS